MQPLCGCYDLQNYFEKMELYMMWEVADGDALNFFKQEYFLPRWWHVNTTADHLYDN